MEEIAYIISTLLLVLGLIGSVIPILPGPLLTYGGALVLYWFTDTPFSSTDIWVMGGVTLLVFVGDYLFQVLGVKKLGGGKMAVRGTIVGTLVGIFFTPIGILIGAFLGAFIGARTETDNDEKALKIAFGSMLGFFLGTCLKVTFAIYMIYYILNLVY